MLGMLGMLEDLEVESWDLRFGRWKFGRDNVRDETVLWEGED